MLILSVMPMQMAVVRLESSAAIPEWGIKGNNFFSITRTDDELSIVCLEENVPSGHNLDPQKFVAPRQRLLRLRRYLNRLYR